MLQTSSLLNIHMKNGYAFHNGDKDENPNLDPPCGQFDDNVGTDVELEQVKTNLLEVVHNFETRLVYHNPEY